jgi:hypothetical protein
MTLGLEEFLKELRAEEGVTALEFNFFESRQTKTRFLRLNICLSDRRAEIPKWLSWDFDLEPTEEETKFPRSFASTLKQIKKEIKNQPNS